MLQNLSQSLTTGFIYHLKSIVFQDCIELTKIGNYLYKDPFVFQPSAQYCQTIQPVEKGLASFKKLLFNKQFLLCFVKTLEAQPGFQIKDKVTVASRISIALQEDMVYHTE